MNNQPDWGRGVLDPLDPFPTWNDEAVRTMWAALTADPDHDHNILSDIRISMALRGIFPSTEGT